MIQPERIRELNERDENPGGRHVLYWMQQSQRAACNHALEYAVRAANARRLPVVVGFGLTARYPGAQERHYAFMLEGLADVRDRLARRGIAFVLRRGEPPDVARDLAAGAAMVVTDRGYLRHQRDWRVKAACEIPVRVVQVESDAVVPVDTASAKEEFAARTLRPKIHRLLDSYLQPLAETPVARRADRSAPAGEPLDDVDALLKSLRLKRDARRVAGARGGETEAQRRLDAFVRDKLASYPELHNEPNLDYTSRLSAHLHFGHISPLDIALRVRDSGVPRIAVETYLEELVVRRELSLNFVLNNENYDRFESLAPWARATLAKHAADPRAYTYDRGRWEAADTHDRYWNAAQREMLRTGRMNNYMRMYWGKKILEWSATPEEAFETARYLNDTYELDGRDPNGYAGVAWCFGQHDRPWTERPVFGTVRYMNAAGLERKFDLGPYLARNA